MTDYTRFYLTGGSFIGYRLYCVDCDGPHDKLPWLTEDPAMDLGEMVRMADAHCAEHHPDGQPVDGEGDDQCIPELGPGGKFAVRWPQPPAFSGVLDYLKEQR